MHQFLLANLHLEGFGKIAVTNLVSVFVLEGNMLSAVRPDSIPASFLQCTDKVILAAAAFFCFQHSHGTFRHITLPGIIDQKIVFIFFPADYLAFFNDGSVKMLSLLCNRKTSPTA